MIMF
ncbi:hypothetical protein CUMW_070910 [Citrus unshiu]